MTSTGRNKEIIQYVPFMSFVHPSFWHSFTQIKLDVDRLDEGTKKIHGRFTFQHDIGAVFEVEGTSFNKLPESEHLYYNVSGIIMNKNTIEEFKTIDKAALLNTLGTARWADIMKKGWIKNPSILLNFLILSFADLKKFNYYYWFAFPSPSQPMVYLTEKSFNIEVHFNNKALDDFAQQFKDLSPEQKCFFILKKDIDNLSVMKLSEVFTCNESEQKDLNLELSIAYFVFLDPSSGTNPGWPLRLFLAALISHCPMLTGSTIRVIGLRCDINGSLEHSRIFMLHIPEDVQAPTSSGWVGWERNDKGNFGPKLANMSASMDPVKLAEACADLNIRLMKWRLVPALQERTAATARCLLLGAGTLGCHVARGLLAWGFRHITFLDSGKVSYSNPTRQVLYTFDDCVNKRKKAEAAADNLKLILPTVKSKALTVHIPMPGHPVGESLVEETVCNIKLITEAILEHDVIFLLLDTREARWLPTLIASCHGKIVINAALGFDTYLVMRHGVSSPSPPSVTSESSAYITGDQLGCYFCNDVTAPGNSVKDRTLDQQCTVTRPGVAAMAGALSVEILVALLQHPQRVNAPAAYNLKEGSKDLPPEIEGILGPIPHSIRGFLHSYESVLPTCAKFNQCIACSNIVTDLYKKEGTEFLLKVFNSGTYLETVTGLSELHLTAEMTDILALSDDDE